MKRGINQSYNPGGNLRASSSNVDNYRNNQIGITTSKNIKNNLVPDTYYFRNNYINIKFDKFNNINSTTNKHSENKNYNYNIIQPQSQSRSKHNMNFGRITNDINNINDMKEEIREFSKSIEKNNDFIKNIEQDTKYLDIPNNRNMNVNLNLTNNKKNKELINSYINININRDDEFPKGENSFRFSSVNNNTNSNQLDINNTSNTYESNNNNNLNNENHYYNIGENKFNYKEYKKSNTNQYKQRKSNNYNNNNNKNQYNIKVGMGKTENLSINKIKELNIRNDSLEWNNISLNKKLQEKEKIINKLIRTINVLKNDNKRTNNINLNNENENKLNILINEFNDSKKILAELKTKDDLILKMGSKINIMEEEINKLKNNQNKEEKFNTEKKTLKDESKEKKDFFEIKNIKREKMKLIKNNSFLNEDKRGNNNAQNFLMKENLELKEQLNSI